MVERRYMKRTLCCIAGLLVCLQALASPARAVSSEVLELCQELVTKAYLVCVTQPSADSCAEASSMYSAKCDQRIVFSGGSSTTTDFCSMDRTEYCHWEPILGYRIHRGACRSDRLRLPVTSDLCGLSAPESGSSAPVIAPPRVRLCSKEFMKRWKRMLKSLPPHRPPPRPGCRLR